jgi:hypothetical protein
MKEEPGSPDGFMFVNYDVKTKGQGPEAPLRSIKRAHVTRQHYRKVRRQRMEEWGSKNGETSTDSSARSAHGVVVPYRKPKAQEPTRATKDIHQSPPAKCDLDEDLRHPEFASSPHSMLGQGRLDPFKLFPAENVPILVQRLLDHG